MFFLIFSNFLTSSPLSVVPVSPMRFASHFPFFLLFLLTFSWRVFFRSNRFPELVNRVAVFSRVGLPGDPAGRVAVTEWEWFSRTVPVFGRIATTLTHPGFSLPSLLSASQDTITRWAR